MNETLLIIFNKPKGEDMYYFLDKEFFGQDLRSNCIAINKRENDYWQNVKEPDILIVKEGKVEHEIYEYIKINIEKKQKYYIVYHPKSQPIADIRKELNNLLCGGEIVYRGYSHDHSDLIYSNIMDLFEYIHDNKKDFFKEYDKYFEKIVKGLNFNSDLEKKLELLQGLSIDAKVKDIFPENLNKSEKYKQAWEEFQSEFGKIKDTEFTIEANKQKHFNDIVSKLRDDLLDENKYEK
jgi:hypothetical protein